MLANGVFPSEQLIGLFTEDGIAAYIAEHHLQPLHHGPSPGAVSGNVKVSSAIPDDYALWNGAAYYSFIHYPCGFTRHKQELWKAVEYGYVHPKDHCMLEEWAAIGVHNPVYLHDCDEITKPVYYNITPQLTVTSTVDLATVDQNRAARHLQHYSTDLRKMALKREAGIIFFFGFFDWR